MVLQKPLMSLYPCIFIISSYEGLIYTEFWLHLLQHCFTLIKYIQMQLIYFRIKTSYIVWYSRLGNHIIVFVDRGKNNSWQMMITAIAFWEETSWNALLCRVKGAWVHEITAGRWARTSGRNLKLKKSKVILLLSANRTRIMKHWLLLANSFPSMIASRRWTKKIIPMDSI